MSYDLTRIEGDRESIVFTLYSRTSVSAAWAVYDITGLTCRMCLKSQKGAKTIYSTADTSPILTVSDGDAGQLTLSPAADTWQGAAAGWEYEYYFEVQVSGKWMVFRREDNTNYRLKVDPKFT